MNINSTELKAAYELIEGPDPYYSPWELIII